MTDAINAVAWSTVTTLQQKMSSQPIGSFWYDIYDHAVELILSGTRNQDPYLLRNAVRDAKSTVRRRKEREAVLSVGSLDITDVAKDVENDPEVEAMRMPSVEHLYAASEQIARLRTAVTVANPKAKIVLALWLEGQSVAVTSEAMSISPDYVKKIRKMILATANNLQKESEVA